MCGGEDQISPLPVIGAGGRRLWRLIFRDPDPFLIKLGYEVPKRLEPQFGGGHLHRWANEGVVANIWLCSVSRDHLVCWMTPTINKEYKINAWLSRKCWIFSGTGRSLKLRISFKLKALF